ncbi:NAD(P)-dependent alcohol dehydrogenase [Herpetosiphon giganteus]|uniref:NAD(P)-dependent alcohol dehydrogenase n=1 Tax=Herpetosiphon giganteus TaxID=2029754 RepID=UPI001957FF61|nr:NAD(P)-dependent alcohol dehydrogenase [Herpetosiphon giganteus]MBM7844359.1 NADPH:quinone reductase-like Zn-dependent oxidoreductase [Herpetosiphon giganteus]
MKAMLCTGYGSPEVLQFSEASKPTPKANELLIRVQAASVTPSDCAFRKGDPFIIKLMYGLRKPKFAILGVEFAGTVEAIGPAVQRFKVGDQVFGMSPNTFGSYGEYLCLPEDKPIAKQPSNVSDAEAVAICDGATTALIFLRDIAKLQAGQHILINGASGAVGIYAVQLAKYYGATVTAVCSATNHKLVTHYGADHVIDYTSSDFTQSQQRYDVVFDAIGKSSYRRCKRLLTANGSYLMTVPSLGIMLNMAWTSLGKGKKAKFAATGLNQNPANLNFLAELIAAGKLKAVIDRRYRLADLAEAHRYVETGRKKGNVVIEI